VPEQRRTSGRDAMPETRRLCGLTAAIALPSWMGVSVVAFLKRDACITFSEKLFQGRSREFPERGQEQSGLL